MKISEIEVLFLYANFKVYSFITNFTCWVGPAMFTCGSTLIVSSGGRGACLLAPRGEGKKGEGCSPLLLLVSCIWAVRDRCLSCSWQIFCSLWMYRICHLKAYLSGWSSLWIYWSLLMNLLLVWLFWWSPACWLWWLFLVPSTVLRRNKMSVWNMAFQHWRSTRGQHLP